MVLSHVSFCSVLAISRCHGSITKCDMALPPSRRFNKTKGPIYMCHTDEFELITYYLYSNWINRMLAFPAENGPKRRAASAGSHPPSRGAS